ncbi:unnamed protein product [Arabis nemorensis]|uniref:Uncharacterized protein n=1 Tax=Arabis nemorensis TaxID=586526 RepID=A0A565AZH9_9BRAS|nr:unnamed protein product [Arabis nemorensis]
MSFPLASASSAAPEVPIHLMQPQIQIHHCLIQPQFWILPLESVSLYLCLRPAPSLQLSIFLSILHRKPWRLFRHQPRSLLTDIDRSITVAGFNTLLELEVRSFGVSHLISVDRFVTQTRTISITGRMFLL